MPGHLKLITKSEAVGPCQVCSSDIRNTGISKGKENGGMIPQQHFERKGSLRELENMQE